VPLLFFYLPIKSIRKKRRLRKGRIAHIFGPVSVQTAQKVRKNGPFYENLFLFQIFRPKSLFIHFSNFVPFCNFLTSSFHFSFVFFLISHNLVQPAQFQNEKFMKRKYGQNENIFL